MFYTGGQLITAVILSSLHTLTIPPPYCCCVVGKSDCRIWYRDKKKVKMPISKQLIRKLVFFRYIKFPLTFYFTSFKAKVHRLLFRSLLMQVFLVGLFITGVPKVLDALVYFLINHLNLRIQQHQNYLQNNLIL